MLVCQGNGDSWGFDRGNLLIVFYKQLLLFSKPLTFPSRGGKAAAGQERFGCWAVSSQCQPLFEAGESLTSVHSAAASPARPPRSRDAG